MQTEEGPPAPRCAHCGRPPVPAGLPYHSHDDDGDPVTLPVLHAECRSAYRPRHGDAARVYAYGSGLDGPLAAER